MRRPRRPPHVARPAVPLHDCPVNSLVVRRCARGRSCSRRVGRHRRRQWGVGVGARRCRSPRLRHRRRERGLLCLPDAGPNPLNCRRLRLLLARSWSGGGEFCSAVHRGDGVAPLPEVLQGPHHLERVVFPEPPCRGWLVQRRGLNPLTCGRGGKSVRSVPPGGVGLCPYSTAYQSGSGVTLDSAGRAEGRVVVSAAGTSAQGAELCRPSAGRRLETACDAAPWRNDAGVGSIGREEERDSAEGGDSIQGGKNRMEPSQAAGQRDGQCMCQRTRKNGTAVVRHEPERQIKANGDGMART